MEVSTLDKKSAALFSTLLKEESYPHFEARAMLLGEKATGKTTIARMPLNVQFYRLGTGTSLKKTWWS
jgi:polynucleotide 5'-kinase involved in rRNA processing